MLIQPFLKSYRKLIALSLLFGWATLAMNLGLQSTSSYLIAKAASRPSTILLLWVPIVAVRFFGTGRGILRYADRLASHNLTLQWLKTLRIKIYRAVEPHLAQDWANLHSGDLVMRISADVDSLQNLYIALWEPVLVGAMALLVVLAVGVMTDISVGLAIIVMLIVSGVLLSVLSASLADRYSRALVTLRSRMSVQFLETWHGLVDSLALNQQDQATARLVAADRGWQATKMRLHRLSGLFQGLSLLVSLLGLWLILVVAIRAVDHHTLAPILLAVIALLTLASFELINGLPAAFQQSGEIQSAQQRVQEMTLVPEPLAVPSNSAVVSAHPTIRLSNVIVQYDKTSSPALTGLSLTLLPNQHMAVIGANGSGKSTLIRVLSALTRIQSGRLDLDGTDLQTMPREDIRKFMGVVNQEPYIFATTLRENLLLARAGATDEALEEAIELSQLGALIASLPLGLDTPLDSRGTSLSGGEIKRVAIARVVLKSAPILLLDEPTEGLDPVSERQVLSNLFAWAAERSVLWVTHRLTNLSLVDTVAVIADGRVVDHGSPEMVMQSNALARRMMRYQLLTFN